MSHKAQAWFPDFAFALLIVLIGIILFFFLVSNAPAKTSRIDENLLTEAQIISDDLMTGGIPANWSQNSTIMIGITDGDYRINSTKLGQLYDMDYDIAKKRFGVYNNFYIEFYTKNNSMIEFFGDERYGKKDSSPENLVKVTRILYSQEYADWIKMNVYVWSNEKTR